MDRPTIEEIDEEFPLPHKYRWRYEWFNRNSELRRIYIQKKKHFLGLFYWGSVQWTVLNKSLSDTEHEWRINHLMKDCGL